MSNNDDICKHELHSESKEIYKIDENTQMNAESKQFPKELQGVTEELDKIIIKSGTLENLASEHSSLSSMLSIECNVDTRLDSMIQKAINTPLSGTVTQHGDIVEFVSDKLDHMIKMSSPIGRSDSESTTSSPCRGSRRNPSQRSQGLASLPRSGSTSLSSASNKYLVDCMNRSTTSTSGWSNEDDFQSSASGWSNISDERINNKTIDPLALNDLEIHMSRISADVTAMTSTLQNHIQKITSVTYTCLDVYKDSVNSTCSTVDNSIKSMYALMAKCEQLCKNKEQTLELQQHVQEINRLLDVFELQLNKSE